VQLNVKFGHYPHTTGYFCANFRISTVFFVSEVACGEECSFFGVSWPIVGGIFENFAAIKKNFLPKVSVRSSSLF